jgi:hypothetical protein
MVVVVASTWQFRGILSNEMLKIEKFVFQRFSDKCVQIFTQKSVTKTPLAGATMAKTNKSPGDELRVFL